MIAPLCRLSRTERTMTVNSNYGDSESMMGLTTPSSTQASSPSASPALSLTDDRKRNKSESEDNQSQRNRFVIVWSTNNNPSASFRSNSGANQGSISHTTYVSSPKTPSINSQQSPSALSTSKPILPSAVSSASALSTSAPPHFAYPATSTTATTTTSAGPLPVLQYATIVSQNTVPSTSTTTATSNTGTPKQSSHILSPPAKQQIRPMSNGTSNTGTSNDSTAMTTSTFVLPLASVTSSSNNSYPPSLLSSTNDRTGMRCKAKEMFLSMNVQDPIRIICWNHQPRSTRIALHCWRVTMIVRSRVFHRRWWAMVRRMDTQLERTVSRRFHPPRRHHFYRTRTRTRTWENWARRPSVMEEWSVNWPAVFQSILITMEYDSWPRRVQRVYFINNPLPPVVYSWLQQRHACSIDWILPIRNYRRC